jgi:hypothetical protein|tara:strand:+ start:546 stop:725 length:180 start_codon:yes stop_codon:yes gene_type:complete
MKVFLTEYKVGEKTYDGPTLVATSFEEAEKQAEYYDVVVVGILEVVIPDDINKWNRVLH